MGVFQKFSLNTAYHYTPLHYLPFICRSQTLLSKRGLEKAGFNLRHLRSMSSRRDVMRGFGDYAFLTLTPQAPILRAKLQAGFPHISIAVCEADIERTDYGLCRYNVAMTRRLRRDGDEGFCESAENGRYHGDHQIPIAKSESDMSAMLEKHLPLGTMIEVLINGDIALSSETVITCFSEEDAEIAARVLKSHQLDWRLVTSNPPGPYSRWHKHVLAVESFIAKAMADPDWKGDGLEFDRLI